MKNKISFSVLILSKSIPFFGVLFLLSSTSASAQAVGTWNFSGTLAGTGTANNTVSAASLGSSLDTSAFTSGVYYAEGNWPSGGVDPNYYLQFSLTPNSGHELSLSAITMNIRRSTTGTAAGSGPNNWSIRSSLDGFTSDITTGSLGLVTTPTITVPLGAAFASLSSAITFRLYGYNEVTTASGFDRFCYQNITVDGLIVLPLLLNNFNASIISGNAVQLNWVLTGDAEVSGIQVERSTDGINFTNIQNIIPQASESQEKYQFVDETLSSTDQNLFYRIEITQNGSAVSYSQTREIVISEKKSLTIVALPVHSGGNVQLKVNADVADNYNFYLYSINGMQVSVKTIALNNGSQFVQMDNAVLHTGLYVLTAERNGQKVTTKVMVQ